MAAKSKRGFHFTGVNLLENKLKKNATMEEVREIVNRNGADLTKGAQRKAPVDTGYLKRYIIMQIASGGLMSKTLSGAEYSGYVNYGTRFMAAIPYMTTAYRVQRDVFLHDMRRLVQ